MMGLVDELELFELDETRKISVGALRRLIPDPGVAVFFGKVYKLNAAKLGELLSLLFSTTVVAALTEGCHSLELQDYIVEEYLIDDVERVQWVGEDPPVVTTDGEVLPHLWEESLVEVAHSIQEVAETVVNTLGKFPSKQGRMVFSHLMKLNRQRQTLGAYEAMISHQRAAENLVVLDVSGSMSERTISEILGDVVALAWNANASLAIVSNNTFYWEPGSFSVESVLGQAEYAGTYYETLAPLFNQDWDSVITIADYDSSLSAKEYLSRSCSGRINKLYDISLVNRPTFLAECLGQFANEVKPLLVAYDRRALVWN